MTREESPEERTSVSLYFPSAPDHQPSFPKLVVSFWWMKDDCWSFVSLIVGAFAYFCLAAFSDLCHLQREVFAHSISKALRRRCRRPGIGRGPTRFRVWLRETTDDSWKTCCKPPREEQATTISQTVNPGPK